MSRENRNLAVMLEPSSVFHYWFPIFKRSLNTCPIFRGHLRGPAGHVTRARVIWSRAHDGFPDRTIGETTSPHYINYRRGARWTWIGLGAVTVATMVGAGLLGPIAIALYAIVLSLPMWFAWWWLAHRG